MSEVGIEELDDARLTLEEWKNTIDSLIKLFGEDAVMYTDAGYNNVTFKVITE
jgi:hypothetical protein